MASHSNFDFIGNLTRDPEVKYTNSGTAVTDVGIAVNDSWTDKATNQRREEVSFFNITIFGRTAEVAGEYLKKGSPVFFSGKIKQAKWNHKETGEERTKTEFVANKMVMLGSGGGSNQGQSQQSQSQPAANTGASTTGDTPF